MKRAICLLLALPLAACDGSSGPEPVLAISESALLRHLNVLAADSMMGRSAGSVHERQAAEYIRSEFRLYGLEEGVPSYFQQFPPVALPEGQLGVLSQNVLGALPGEGHLAGQWVIVGAHYDHVGFEPVSEDSVLVYNGADDNASGTAMLLEIARFMTEYAADVDTTGASRRSIMFQAYGAEEAGLVGSRFFCDNPSVPMDSVVAMLNFDMIGRLRGNRLIMIGSSSSGEWRGEMAAANTQGLSLEYTEEALNRSDQACFYERGRPVLFFHTGLHAQYHSPLDDVWLINEGGMVRVGAVAVELLLDLIRQPEALAAAGGAVLTNAD